MLPRAAEKKLSPLRTKLTKKKLREKWLWLLMTKAVIRSQTRLELAENDCHCFQYIQNHNPATVSMVQTWMLLRTCFPQLHVDTDTTLHSLDNLTLMSVCPHTLTHPRVTIKYTCWGRDSVGHLDKPNCGMLAVCVYLVGYRMSYSTLRRQSALMYWSCIIVTQVKVKFDIP